MNLHAQLAARRQRVNDALEELLPRARGPAKTVVEAMRYAVLSGGKRLRPFLVLAACEACGGSEREAVEPAAALELVHTYSLVHDDLPAMDDDDLRRGRPTVHRAYGDAVAILAGDALLTLAFEWLSTRPEGRAFASRRLQAVTLVARAAGAAGMVGGQTADLEAEARPVDVEGLRWIHRHKTGALFSAAAELGAIHAGAGARARRALRRYGESLGLAFQVADDILDRTATAAELGKTPGKDRRSGKTTYPSLFGVEKARAFGTRLADEAIGVLEELERPAPMLEGLARLAVSRTS